MSLVMAVRKSKGTLRWTKYSSPRLAQPDRAVPALQTVQSVLTSRIQRSFSPLTLSSGEDNYTYFESLHKNRPAAFITEESSTKYWVVFLFNESSKYDVVKTLSSSPVLVKLLDKQFQILKALENVLPGKLSFKLWPADIFTSATALSHHKTLTTSVK